MSLPGRVYDAMWDGLVSIELSMTGDTKDGPLVDLDYETQKQAVQVATDIALAFVSYALEPYKEVSKP